MKEIKIQNSNLFLIETDIGGTNKYTLGSSKKKMRYQMVVVENLVKNEISTKFTYGERCTYFPTSDHKKLYILMKNNKRFDKDIKLSEEESVSVLKFLREFIKYYPLECEPLVFSLRDKNLIETYQSSYGKAISSTFIPLVSELIQDPSKINMGNNTDEFLIKDYRRRYSIIDFLEELKNDPESRIKVIPDILHYNRVSPKTTDLSKNTVEYLDTPGKILSISKSKSKANINITYNALVNITTPDGTEYKEYSSLKNFCIMKEGKLNTKHICVKINPKLAGKLKRFGAIYTKLLKDTYILDLSKLPLYSRNNVGSVQAWMLEKYEYNFQCLKFKEEYIKFLMEAKGITPSVSLEIDTVNKTYSPKSAQSKSNCSYWAWVYETEITDSVFPKTSAKRRIIFNNSGSIENTGSTPGNIIKEVNQELQTETLEDLLSRTRKEMKKNNELLTNSRFKLILSKDCKFNSGMGSSAYGRPMSISGKYGKINLMWNIKEQKIYTYEKGKSIN